MTAEMKLIQKLAHAQVELKAPKGQYNSFGKYKYRSAEDILEAVKPINLKYGLTLILLDTVELIGDRFYVKATALISDGADSLTVTAYAREEESKKGMDGSQITGTASSYARKYALNGLYLIDDTKDADTDEYANQQNKGKNRNQDKKSKAAAEVVSDEEKANEFKAWVTERYEELKQNKGLTAKQVNDALAAKVGIATKDLKAYMADQTNFQKVAGVLLEMNKVVVQ